MAQGCFKNAFIQGIATVVPSYSRSLDDEIELFGNVRAIEKAKKTTGLLTRRIVDKETTSLDLCCVAANEILNATNEKKEDIDAVIFVTQTPDHMIPNNSSLVHGLLELSENCLCYDINHGCSGYIYGLLNAFSLIESGMCKNILLLVGDTLTKAINPRDKSLAIIHGDAGSATIIKRRDEINNSKFIFHSNGKKSKGHMCKSWGL